MDIIMMSIPENKKFKKIQFYLTANYNCGIYRKKKHNPSLPHLTKMLTKMNLIISSQLVLEVGIMFISLTVTIVKLANLSG